VKKKNIPRTDITEEGAYFILGHMGNGTDFVLGEARRRNTLLNSQCSLIVRFNENHPSKQDLPLYHPPVLQIYHCCISFFFNNTGIYFIASI
jgi:hypothetical protein